MDEQLPKKAKPWWVWVLVIFGILALLGMLGIGGIVWWFSANKDKFVAMAKQAEQESTEFAGSHEQSACIDEGLRRSDACDGIMCQAEAKVFTQRCILKATPTAGFCDGAPAPGEIMATVRYTQAQCEKHGRRADDQKCTQLMQAIGAACNEHR
ncbi:MAG TPA: hypothetical protein VIF62_06550 [Labilithrix sp.]